MGELRIPAAEPSESDEGDRWLVASSAEARAEFEPPKDGKGDGFLIIREHGHTGGVLLSADGARAAIAVLTRWLVESNLPETADHPPARLDLFDSPPEGWVRISTTQGNWRGWRYLFADGEWHRTFQLTPTDVAVAGGST